ncbi:MAG: hypothetical protein HOO67_00685 [Candidatus Peribacteraceae bacterium]|nr:hypothetical protein [Candidatus Peribacteraceae bacterium]
MQLLSHLINHERKPLCLEKLHEQIVLVEKRSPNLKATEFESVIKASAQMFCRQAINMKAFEILSANEKSRLIAKHERLDRLQKEADAESVSVKHWMDKKGRNA